MRIPLPPTLRNRGSNTDKDARALNCVVEDKGKVRRLVKRPALEQAFVSVGGGTGQLLTTRTTPEPPVVDPEPPIVIVDDVLTTGLAPSVRELSFSVQPSEPAIGAAISPAVVVHALNSLGNIATGYTGNVTMSLDTNPTGATLGGTVTVAAVAGVATFSNLTINRSGEGYRLQASSGALTPATSNTFDVPTQGIFTDQPQSTQPDTTMANVVVTVQDNTGATDTGYTGNVTLELFPISGSGTLTGTATRAAIAGVATFNDLKVTAEGYYDLKATFQEISTAYPPASRFSSAFGIADWALIAEQRPGEPAYFGFEAGVFGSLTPTIFDGVQIAIIESGLTAVVLQPFTQFQLASAPPEGQGFFTSMTINGTTLLTSQANYSFGVWLWLDVRLITGTGFYAVTLTK